MKNCNAMRKTHAETGCVNEPLLTRAHTQTQRSNCVFKPEGVLVILILIIRGPENREKRK
jgi:hypothetical protein